MNHGIRLALVILLGTLGTIREASAQFPPATPNDTLKSPEVLEDNRVTFRIYAPQADEVQLATSGDIPGIGFGESEGLAKNSEGVWEVTLGPLPPGAYRYNFTVDGVTTVDPKNRQTSESNQVTWSLLDVPGTESQSQTGNLFPGNPRAGQGRASETAGTAAANCATASWRTGTGAFKVLNSAQNWTCPEQRRT